MATISSRGRGSALPHGGNGREPQPKATRCAKHWEKDGNATNLPLVHEQRDAADRCDRVHQQQRVILTAHVAHAPQILQDTRRRLRVDNAHDLHRRAEQRATLTQRNDGEKRSVSRNAARAHVRPMDCHVLLDLVQREGNAPFGIHAANVLGVPCSHVKHAIAEIPCRRTSATCHQPRNSKAEWWRRSVRARRRRRGTGSGQN